MDKYEVCIESTSPMLHHGSQNVGRTKNTKKKGGEAVMGDPDEWKKSVYFNSKEGVYIPSVNLEASFIDGAKAFKIGRGTASKYFKSAVFIDGNMIPIEVKGKRITDIEDIKIDSRTIKNPSTKGRQMRYRAVFDSWKAYLSITLLESDFVSEEMLKDVITYSGQYVGVCDFRPRFGRFSLVSFKKVS